MARHLFTSESVTEGHPDKICDQISDAILDAILAEDPDGTLRANRLVYSPDSEAAESYRRVSEKPPHRRRRRAGRSRAKKTGAEKQIPQ